MRVIRSPHAIDLPGTLFPLLRGPSDPTMRIDRTHVWRSMRTPEGAATLHLSAEGPAHIRAEAWGPGDAWALDHAAGLAGAEDDETGFEPRHEVIRELWRRHRAVRLTRAALMMPTVLAAILEQKVTGMQARRAWKRMVLAVGEPAPGPLSGLLLPPDPARLAGLPYFAFHPFGVERRRAEVIKAVCARADRLDGPGSLDLLGSIAGIGPWTLAETARLTFGDPDAVSVGDFHLPNLVAWALAGEARGDDERMLELLEPYRGHRGRVQRLLEAGHIKPPSFGPRMESRSIDKL